MAIFEKKIERKITLDDTQILSCVIETAQKVDGHTEYVLKVQRGPLKENCWKILRRYNDFVELNKLLQISGIKLPLPGKKIIGNMQPEFIAQRRIELQEYINLILMNPILASSLPTKKFVDPDSYSTPFHDLALQNASLCLRTEGIYTLGTSLGPIGWRLRKHYFKVFHKSHNKNSPGQSTGKHSLVKSSSQSHSKHHIITTQTTTNTTTSSANGQTGFDAVNPDFILSWTEYGPDKYIDDKEIHNVIKNLGGCQHPYIIPIEYVISNDCGALVIRKIYRHGSLKDILCGSSPLNPFLSKYGNPKGRYPLPLKDVALYGRQILEALKFLHSKGLPYGHLHTGNVIISEGAACLLDIENILIGVPAFYRPFFVQHSKINSFEAIDVYSFGHLMFEMSMGYPLQESVARHISDCPEILKKFLESILAKESLKSGLPTLDQLTQHQFFHDYASNYNELYVHAFNKIKPHLKLSLNAKEQIKNAVYKTELRLKDEQKSVKNQKRIVRVQEFMSSEEEKRKIKQKVKMEHKQAKLKQQNSLQLQNGPAQSNNTAFSRSDSVNSVASTPAGNLASPPYSVTAPLPAPPPPPPPLPKLMENNETEKIITSVASTNSPIQRTALLDSICSFKKNQLKKVSATDK